MGQSIGFFRRVNDPARAWKNHESADDAPDDFTQRFDRRWEWFQTIFDVPHEHIRTCGCGESCAYGCPGDYMVRVTDFAAFRAKLKKQGLLEPDEDGDCIFREMTDWLEQHPDVYVGYS